jgi:rSAM/selenodomain-associated transferase 1
VASVIILFARAPVPGHTKTRLAKTIGPEAAAALHLAFVADLVESFQQLTTSDLELHTDTQSDAWQQLDVARKPQISGGLELKMLHAFQEAFRAGYERVAIVGTDAPTVPRHYVEELLAVTADIGLGPADDGGFYAIAARRTHPRMFAGVRWSEPDTLMHTVAAIEAAGLTSALGPPWFDVDEISDLQRLFSGPVPRHTAAWLRAHISRIGKDRFGSARCGA